MNYNELKLIIFFGNLACKLATEEELWIELSQAEMSHSVKITLTGFGKQLDFIYNVLELAENTLDVSDLVTLEAERLLNKFYESGNENEF